MRLETWSLRYNPNDEAAGYSKASFVPSTPMPEPKPQASSLKPSSVALRTTFPLRVRYTECDPMGFVHHSVYPIWFELARTELLRESGLAYSELEKAGTIIVVVKLDVRYHKPAKYDDQIEVTATLKRSAGVRIEHEYEVRRGHERLCTGSTTLACLDRSGKIVAVPEPLYYDPKA